MVVKEIKKLDTCLLLADLKESMDYLSKKYGDKEKDHVTLVRAFSTATEKVGTRMLD